MVFFLAGFCLLLHTLFWGLGIALLITPRRWRPGWPAWSGVLGLAAQSAVVWAGAHTSATGAAIYGRISLLIPAILLVVGLWKAGRENRSVLREIWAWRGLGLLGALVLSLMLVPFAEASRVLTTSSLGSCDAADYAAGARTLLEFARTDRSGFMGLTEVVQVHSVDNFFDYWLRLNHFTPSAVIALNAAVFGWRPYELVSVTTAVFLVLSLPIVYWMARATFRFPRKGCAWIAATYGLSPVLWYAVYHTAMSQIVAASAIALLTSVALAAWTERTRSWPELLKWSGILFAVHWLLLGAYNFILLVCFVPSAAYAVVQVVTTGRMRGTLRWSVALVLPLLLAGLVFLERVEGLAERLLLLQEYDFGWPIPALTPEAWLGAVGSVTLEPLHVALRWTLSFCAVGLSLWALAALGPKRGKWRVAASLTLPILVGYWYLLWRGKSLGTNASYDAYKLFAVFYPGIICVISSWLFFTVAKARHLRTLGYAVALVFSLGTLFGAIRYIREMRSPPLMVGEDLASLSLIEEVPEVASINMLIEPFWDRLWANTFLLRKAQYFASHTYEGRRNCGLHGEWNLYGDVFSLRSAHPVSEELAQLPLPFSMVRRGTQDALRLALGEGWYPLESIPRAGVRWRWTQGTADLRVFNPRKHPVRTTVRLKARALNERTMVMSVNDRPVGTHTVGVAPATVELGELVFEPGLSTLRFSMPGQIASPGGGDQRPLGLAVFSLEFLETKPVAEGGENS